MLAVKQKKNDSLTHLENKKFNPNWLQIIYKTLKYAENNANTSYTDNITKDSSSKKVNTNTSHS
jgi:hypothetical protein